MEKILPMLPVVPSTVNIIIRFSIKFNSIDKLI